MKRNIDKQNDPQPKKLKLEEQKEQLNQLKQNEMKGKRKFEG